MPERLTSLRIPVYRSRLRAIPVVYGALLLLWSSLEDNSVLPVALLGSGLALVIIVLWILRRCGGRTVTVQNGLLGAGVLGAVTGLTGAAATAALMLIKDGLHSDLYPDYPFGLIMDMLARAPLWALAGLFAGIGLLLAWWAFTLNRQNSVQSEGLPNAK